MTKSKKEKFIEFVEVLMDESSYETWDEVTQEEWSDALVYFEALKMSDGIGKEVKQFTENGKLVLQYMKDHKTDYNNLFRAKDIGEGLGISSRTASGATRKLVNDGFVEKLGENPTIYSLTKKGEEVEIEA